MLNYEVIKMVQCMVGTALVDGVEHFASGVGALDGIMFKTRDEQLVITAALLQWRRVEAKDYYEECMVNDPVNHQSHLEELFETLGEIDEEEIRCLKTYHVEGLPVVDEYELFDD